MNKIDDLRIRAMKPLIPPAVLLEEVPTLEPVERLVQTSRDDVAAAVRGDDDRLVAIVGPCSIHDPEAALDYAQRLAKVAEQHREHLIVVMRCYFEKPRTVAGWRGLINDPDLDGTFHINKGLRIARQLLVDVNSLGLPVAAEFLDNIIPQYIADQISWVAIGARTTESQIHREFASGCSMPVGFKNSTSGEVQAAIDAVRAAALSHWFPSVTKQGISAILQTSGNESCHIILRGGSKSGPNYDEASVTEISRRLTQAGLRSQLMVDFSHGNCAKDPTRMMLVGRDVARQLREGSPHIFGVMFESNLVSGRQDYIAGKALVYGQSITDPCVSFAETEELLAELAAATAARRRSGVMREASASKS
ncbi:MAG: 3-deoxy-7-phosphoheptulonate synthase [Fimbriimonadaceae bacterium]